MLKNMIMETLIKVLSPQSSNIKKHSISIIFYFKINCHENLMLF